LDAYFLHISKHRKKKKKRSFVADFKPRFPKIQLFATEKRSNGNAHLRFLFCAKRKAKQGA
jgi:hypothetical protein